MLFDTTDFNYEISLFQIPGSDFSLEQRVDRFYSPEEGFLRGNMMRDEFDSYKKYTYFKLKPETEKEQMLFQLMAYSFAINDLNLFLDMHPEDRSAYDLFKQYVNDKNELESMYVKRFGPMTVTETNGANYNWISNPWPWDKMGGSKYV